MSNNNLIARSQWAESPILDPTKRMTFTVDFELAMGSGNIDPNTGRPRQIEGHLILSDVKTKRWIRDYIEQEFSDRAKIIVSRNAVEAGGCLDSVRAQVLKSSTLPPGMDQSEVLQRELWDVRCFGYVNAAADTKKTESDATKALEKAQKELKDLKDAGEDPAKIKRAQAKVDKLTLSCEAKRAESARADEIKDRKLGRTQILGPIQLMFGVSPNQDSVTTQMLTRLISKKGVKESGEEKTTDFGHKPLVARATFHQSGTYSAHLGQRAGVSREDLGMFFEGLIYGCTTRPSATSGQWWASRLHVNVFDDAPGSESCRQYDIEFEAPDHIQRSGVLTLVDDE